VRGRVALAVVALIAVGLSLWHYLVEVAAGPPTTFDDAYMFVRYAKQVLAGRGLAWNPDGVPTYGVTSLLFTAVVTALRALTDMSDAGLVRFASTASALAAVLVMIFTAWRYTSAPALRRNLVLWTGLIAPAILASGTFVYHSRTGMDTTLSLLTNALVVLATLHLVERASLRAVIPVVIAGYLTVLARPDNGLYATLFPAAAILLCVPRPAKLRLCAVFSVAIVAVLGADAALKLAVFGVPLPLPSYAKTQAHLVGYAGAAQWNAMAYLLEFVALALPFLCVLVLCAGRRSARLVIALLVPTALTLGVYFGMLQVMGYRARFDFPSLPFLVMAAVAALDGFFAAWAEPGSARPTATSLLARAVAILALIALVPTARVVLPTWYRDTFLSTTTAVPPANPGGLPKLAYWDSIAAMIDITSRAPAGTVVSMSEYGCVGAAVPEVTIVDPLGLHDLAIAKHGFAADAFFAREPDLIWMPHPDYVALRRAILRSDELWSGYDVYPAAFDFGVALRRAGPRADAVRALFAEVWQKAYPGQSLDAHRLAR
jgi:hypothetical protein